MLWADWARFMWRYPMFKSRLVAYTKLPTDWKISSAGMREYSRHSSWWLRFWKLIMNLFVHSFWELQTLGSTNPDIQPPLGQAASSCQCHIDVATLFQAPLCASKVWGKVCSKLDLWGVWALIWLALQCICLKFLEKLCCFWWVLQETPCVECQWGLWSC